MANAWCWDSNSEDENECVLDGVDGGDKDDDIDIFDEEDEASLWWGWRLRGTGIGFDEYNNDNGTQILWRRWELTGVTIELMKMIIIMKGESSWW